MSLLLSFTCVAAVLGGCAVNELEEKEDPALKEEGMTILRASVSESAVTRTAFTDEGVFSWTADDAISVYTTGGEFKEFTLYSGEGGSSASFIGDLGGANTSSVAVYPHSAGHSLSEKTLTVSLPASYTWSSDGNAHAPMISVLSEGSTALSFSHIGGLVKVSFSDVPAATRKMVFTTAGKKIAGVFVISDYTVSGCTVSTSSSVSDNSVTILTPSPVSAMDFYIPLPVGDYDGFEVQLQDSSNEPLVMRSHKSSFTIERRALKRMKAIDGEAFNGKVLLFDFGHSGDANCPSTDSPDANSNYWNNIQKTGSGKNGMGSSFGLVYTDNTSSGYSLTLLTDFWSNGSANGGLTEAKWSETTASSLGIMAVGTATQDYFFAQGASTVCTFQLSGLNPSCGYKFYMFGSRASTVADQRRDAKYSISGSNSFEDLLIITGPGAKGTQNTDNLLVSDLIYPRGDGTINVSVSKGYNSQSAGTNEYYQLNCMKVEEYEGGLIPPIKYAFTSLEVTSSEETFLMHRAAGSTSVFEGVSTFSSGTVSMEATTEQGKVIPLEADCSIDGVAYFVADLDNGTFTFTEIPSILCQGSALNGWSTTNGATLTYQGAGVFSGEDLTFVASGLTTATAVSNPSRFNFLIRGSWNPTFKRVNGTRRDIECSGYGTTDDIRVNPGVYDVTLNLRTFTFDIAASAVDPDRITVMGSSVPRGYTATDYKGYVFLYDDILRSRGDFYVSNISVAGNNTLNLLDRYDELVTDGGAYVVFALSLGNEGIHGAADQEAVYSQWKTNMQTLISKARADGKTVVVTGNYARADYTADDYSYVKAMNLEIHGWDVPSVNLLGAIDDGNGRWATGYDAGDTYHPNNDGHIEMSKTIVPSLFDALKAGKAAPVRNSSGSRTLSSRNVIKIEPEESIHPFTVSFGIRTSSSGDILAFNDGAASKTVSVTGGGVLSYEGITGSTTVSDGAWHQVTLTHFYARGETLLYVDGVLQGTESENVEASEFYVGYSASDASADFREIFFWRSGMNAEEISALEGGEMLKSSLEFYAPLVSGSLDNIAQSTATLSITTL